MTRNRVVGMSPDLRGVGLSRRGVVDVPGSNHLTTTLCYQIQVLPVVTYKAEYQ